MKLSFSFEPKTLIDKCTEQNLDIYHFLKEKGFDHTFNWAKYKNNEVLITYYNVERPMLVNAFPGELYYVINFEKDESEIFVEQLADDIQLYWDSKMTDSQGKLIENLNKRISVKELQELNNIPINWLYGFCVDYIYPKDIFSWSVYMTTWDERIKHLFTENI